jgi:hypothetical protein
MVANALSFKRGVLRKHAVPNHASSLSGVQLRWPVTSAIKLIRAQPPRSDPQSNGLRAGGDQAMVISAVLFRKKVIA